MSFLVKTKQRGGDVRINRRRNKERSFVLIVAPDVPPREVMVLRKDWESRRNIVKNYEFEIKRITVPSYARLLVIAPDVPTTEVKALKKHIQYALKNPEYTVITNYEVSIKNIAKRHEAYF